MKPSSIIVWLARALAILGGIVLAAVVVMTVASISGRAFTRFGLGPVPGDFELVQAGVGFSVFAFLPWCQLNRGHATVDIVTAFFSNRANHIIDLLTEILMTVVLGLIAWQLYYGMRDKLAYGETSFILQFPMWWPYAACFVASVVATMVSAYMITVRFHELRAGTPMPELGQGSVH
ncbi:TRAP transporter small permease [Nitratireductor sp. ZSWI3]|uniref:TRAP transporter small permease n=1 Tax=Nitratireductor sp. ZSWI3 TaxID=2966359 RepID=UPI00214F6966|nr:TRAP transporter small permease [Nitratireductor sp. ZSWI3]MCR4268362.1 TRAP transporter small permease [Nitratireductor sp. ZSWI3]